MDAVPIEPGVYMIESPGLTLPEGCSVYLIDAGTKEAVREYIAQSIRMSAG